MKDLVRNTILLTVTCLIASGLLAAVYQKTKPMIEENKIRKEIGALQDMVPEVKAWVGMSKSGREILRAVQSSAKGHKNEIEVLIIIDSDGTCISASIVAQNETPKNFDRVQKGKLLNQFTDKTLKEIKLRKEGGKIDAVTGATNSSMSIIKAVRKGMELAARDRKRAKKKGKGEEETIDDVETWIGKGLDGNEICRVVKSGERGYGSTIKVLVAIGSDGTCTAVTVIGQNETPGLGVKVTTEKFLSQFKGKKQEEIKLKNDGGTIDAITGATISSRAAAKAVRKAMQPLDKK